VEENMALERPATLQDVADLCGISRGTASRALTGEGRISLATRMRVAAAAEQLNYVTNSGARNLRRARAGAIGLWLPQGLRFMEYYMNFTFGLVEGTQDHELAVSLIPGNLSERKVAGLHVDGFVLADVDGSDGLARAILEGPRPTVSSELVPPEMPQPTATVAADHASGTRNVLDRLHERGARSIGILAPHPEQMWVREAVRAAEEWSPVAGVEVHLSLLREVPAASDLSNIVRGMLAEHPNLDAILCLPEGLSVGVLTALQALGRSVPDDMQLASYTDSPSLLIIDPPISAIDLRPREAGFRAGQLLISLLDTTSDRTPASPPTIDWLDIPFHLRGSTRALPGSEVP
jgi:DNA-binding LacI/PurR family transcriptional regulator